MNEVVDGRFRLVGVLGEGAMGVVYRAYDEVLDRELALKEMRVPVGVDVGEALDRFVTEARAAARLSDPAIVTVHDVVQDGDRVLIAMELLAGATLADVLASGPGGVAPDQVREVMSSVASALAVAHGQGVVHRDLKPDNVFWLETGRVVVTDFGLARIGAGRGTQLGTVMGTPGYMAPEQIRGDVVGPAADVFAWGAVAHELLVGAPVFGGPELDAAALMWRVVHEPAPLLDIPSDPELAAVVGWALEKDPAARPGDGAVLLDALRHGVGARSVGVVAATAAMPSATSSVPSFPPATVPMATRPGGGRSTGVVVGMVAAVLVVIAAAVGLVVALTGGSDPTTAATTQVATNRTTDDDTHTTPTTEATTTTTTAPVSAPVTVVGSSPSSTRASANLRCTGERIHYTGDQLHDGDLATGWGTAPGDGTGQSIQLTLDRTVRLTSVGLTPGYAKVGPREDAGCQPVSAFERNRFVTSVEYRFDDGSTVVQTFDRNPSIQRIPVDVQTSTVTVTILGTQRPPGADDDTIMSEVEFLGR